ncbi:MAG: SDR family oxidoreductase [Acidimicrobiia bacterium]|nr:SDR family oxidoreductase [Acidimicrobiia bacterium]
MTTTTLSGRRAVVTGGSRGLGRGIALALAKEGADVGIIYRKRIDEAEEVAREIEKEGVRAVIARADVAQWEEASAAVSAVADDLGGLDIVVANAGVANPTISLIDTPPERWRKIMGVNLDGAFFTVKAAVPHILAAGRGGSVVFVSTVGSLKGAPMQGAYVSSKAAVNEMARTWALELAAEGIRVNAVAPGIFETDMTSIMLEMRGEEASKALVPLGRVGAPIELGRTVAMLCSDAASYVTGEVIRVDGGLGA